jgi:hypothetical protein
MFRVSKVVQDQLIAADGTQQFDLGVNPLSALMLGFRPLNDTGTLANFNRVMGLMLHGLAIRVLYRGAAVKSISGRDLVALNYFRHGMIPFEANGDNVNNERRCLCVPLLMGRHAYDPDSCLPAAIRGELTLEVQFDIAITGSDGLTFDCEMIELPDASPSHYERTTTVARTFPATGFNDVPLAMGNKVRGLLLFGTTPFGGATPAPSWGRFETLLDNEQVGIAASDWEMMHQYHQMLGIQPPTGQRHAHIVTTDGNAQTELATLAGPHGEGLGEGWEQYAIVDFDPTRDDAHSIDTAGHNSWLVRANAETADAVRVVQIEAVTL